MWCRQDKEGLSYQVQVDGFYLECYCLDEDTSSFVSHHQVERELQNVHPNPLCVNHWRRVLHRRHVSCPNGLHYNLCALQRC